MPECFSGGGGSSWQGGLLGRGSPWRGSPWRGVSLTGGSPWQGVSLVGGSPWQGGIPACSEADPPVNRMTDRCKNITLATTSLRPVIILHITLRGYHDMDKLKLGNTASIRLRTVE